MQKVTVGKNIGIEETSLSVSVTDSKYLQEVNQ